MRCIAPIVYTHIRNHAAQPGLSGLDVTGWNMGCTYTIAQGDTLPAIAARFGFADWNTIYNLPENASSRDLRPNPNLLHPGHELYFRIGRTANSPGRPTSCTSSFATGIHKCYACPGHPPNLTEAIRRRMEHDRRKASRRDGP